VKTLKSKVDMKIPKSTQIDTRLLMRGKGIKGVGRGGGGMGDQIGHLRIEIPKNVTTRQEELLREFDEIGNGSVVSRITAQSESFFDKVGAMFGDGDGDKDKDGEGEGGGESPKKKKKKKEKEKENDS